MSGDNPYEDHGHSVAAWTGVGICIIGSLIIALGVWYGNTMLDIVGTVLFLAGGVVGWVMGKASNKRATPRTPIDSERKIA